MRRSLCLLLLIPSFALSQNVGSSARGKQSLPAGSPPSSAVEVLYVVDNSVLTTYNIDPQTFQATAVGTTTMPSAKYVSIQTSSDGRFRGASGRAARRVHRHDGGHRALAPR